MQIWTGVVFTKKKKIQIFHVFSENRQHVHLRASTQGISVLEAKKREGCHVNSVI